MATKPIVKAHNATALPTFLIAWKFSHKCVLDRRKKQIIHVVKDFD
jgi:hypothetical protein